jgi:hypothetical protein
MTVSILGVDISQGCSFMEFSIERKEKKRLDGFMEVSLPY